MTCWDRHKLTAERLKTPNSEVSHNYMYKLLQSSNVLYHSVAGPRGGGVIPPTPVKTSQKKMAATPCRKFRKSSGPSRTNVWIRYCYHSYSHITFCYYTIIHNELFNILLHTVSSNTHICLFKVGKMCSCQYHAGVMQNTHLELTITRFAF